MSNEPAQSTRQSEINTDDLLAAVDNLRGHRCNAQTRYLAHVDAVYQGVATLVRENNLLKAERGSHERP